MNKLFTEVQDYVKRMSQRNNWKLTSDQEALNDLIDGLSQNFKRYGYYNCPCRDSQDDRTLDRDIICPCLYAKPDIEQYGHCYCGLYFKQEYTESHLVSMIPERRKNIEYHK
ncbi:MAG: ferredoxin-thioredoxin reductase catalytic domain-containing protein [Candidatus Hodarchaeota archaeon]